MTQEDKQTEQNQIKDHWPIISLLVIVLAVAVGYFVVYPNMQALKELNIQIGAKDLEAKALDEKITDLTALSKNFSQNQAKIDKFSLAFPKNDDMSGILNNVSAIAAGSGLTISSVNQQKATKTSEYTPVEIGFSGSFKSLSLFLDGLEKNIRPSSPKDITISTSSNQQGDNQNVVSGKIDLDFFKVSSGESTAQKNVDNKEE